MKFTQQQILQQFRRSRYITKIFLYRYKNGYHILAREAVKYTNSRKYENDTYRDMAEINFMKENKDYYKQLEKDWRVSLPSHTPQELQEIYNITGEEATKYRKKNLRQQLNRLDNLICEYLLWNRELKKNKTIEWLIDINSENIDKLKKEYYKIKRQIKWLKPSSWRQEDGQQQQSFDLETIKQISIIQILEHYNIEIVNNNILCPIHKENTASCHIYENTNTFHCFGCHEGGSVIDLVIAIEETDFLNACKILNNF